MRFYGVLEERMVEIIENVSDGEWIIEEDGKKEELSAQEVKEKLLELVQKVKTWKEENKYIPSGTIFFFVSTPDSPQAFKVYDLSSLGCSTKLDPARWKIYKKELLGQV